MQAELPWYHDPIKAEYEHPGDTLKAIRNGALDLFCGHCGAMGKRGVWFDSVDKLCGIRCPNCGEYRGQPIREVEPQPHKARGDRPATSPPYGT